MFILAYLYINTHLKYNVCILVRSFLFKKSKAKINKIHFICCSLPVIFVFRLFIHFFSNPKRENMDIIL